jgi:hypothetical protein
MDLLLQMSQMDWTVLGTGEKVHIHFDGRESGILEKVQVHKVIAVVGWREQVLVKQKDSIPEEGAEVPFVEGPQRDYFPQKLHNEIFQEARHMVARTQSQTDGLAALVVHID